MTNYSTVIQCAEKLGEVGETFNLESGMSATVTVQCAYAARHALVAEVMGTAYPNSSFGNPPQCINAVIRPLQGESAGTAGQTNIYTTAEVTFTYSSKVQDLVSESLEPTAEFLTQDYRMFRWGAANGDPLTEGEAPGKLFKGMNIVRTLYQLTSAPASILTAIGGVNVAEYTSSLLGLTFAPETLLYQPPHLARIIKTDGTIGRTVTMKFGYKPQTWNKYWRARKPGGAGYDSLYLASGGICKPYVPTDLSELLF